MTELFADEHRRKEQHFGLVLVVIGGIIGAVQGSPLVIAASAILGVGWYLGATVLLGPEGSA